jgi:hypothetical protein
MALARARSLYLAGVLLGWANMAASHEVSQRLGGYKSSDGESRSAGGVSASLEPKGFGRLPITSAAYTFDAGIERIRSNDLSTNEYMQLHFPEGSRLQRSAGLQTVHTVSKITDIRAGGSWGSDDVSTSRSANAGVGHWWLNDTVQTNIDISRTINERPESSILDYDAQLIRLAPSVDSAGGVLTAKYLATPTTVWAAAYTRIVSSDRPQIDAYTLQLKQFFPAITGAVHGSISRIINTGEVTTSTNAGSLAGVQAEVAFLKSLWRDASMRLGYRFVREDEETRATGDHLVYGADSYSLGLLQDFKKGVVTDRPTSAHIVATRYLSNAGYGAVMGEAGLAVKF